MRGKHSIILRTLVLFCLGQHADAWSPGVSASSATYGYSVNTQDRTDVVSFWYSVYGASENYRDVIAWTGSYTSTSSTPEGTTSQAFVNMVEKRVNYFRAMCGLPANVRLNTGSTVIINPTDVFKPDSAVTKAQATQRAAYMISKAGVAAMSHDPVASLVGWTTAAWNANANSDLAYGFFGPTAIDAYLKEDIAGTSSWNVNVGHRRWLLYPPATDMATGDSPGSFSDSGVQQAAANVLYVSQKDSELASVNPVFVSYPPAGYVPASLNTNYWSLSYPGADFADAKIQMTDGAGSSIPLTKLALASGYGSPTVVWQIDSSYAATAVEDDTTFHVTVSGISGKNVPASYSWNVTLIDPSNLHFSPLVSGSQIVDLSGSNYTVTPMNQADRLETNFALVSTSSWTEGAEDALSTRIIDGTDDYPLRAAQGGFVRTGSKSFHLTHAVLYDASVTGIPDQSFTIDREIIPGSSGVLSFYYRRGYMTPSSHLAVQVSQDQGNSWTTLGDDIVGSTGGSGNLSDSAFVAATRALPVTDEPVRIRFRYYYSFTGSASAYSYSFAPSFATGIYIDDVTVSSGTKSLDGKATVTTTTETTVPFNTSSAGAALAGKQAWYIRSRVILGGHAFPYGTALKVSVADSTVGSPPVVETPSVKTTDEKNFDRLDTNADGSLSRSEWLALYPVAPAKEAIFDKVDLDKDGFISYAEMSNVASLKQKIVAQYFTRGAAFQELDVNQDDVISTDELSKMFLPPVVVATVLKYGSFTYEQWQYAKTLPSFPTWVKAKVLRATRAAAFQELDTDHNGTISITELNMMFSPPVAATATSKYGTYTLNQWVEAKTLPSFPTWDKAKIVRAAREDFLMQLDANSDGVVSSAEFSHLFKAGTLASKILPSWLTATATAKGGVAPDSITNAQFIEAKLPAKLIYYAW